MKYLPLPPSLFTENRKRFAAKLKPHSLAIFNSNDEMPRTGDQNYPFRQHPDFFYLTGIDQEQSILLIYPDCPNPAYREILFLRKTNEHIAVWEGHKYTMQEAKDASGMQSIYWTEDFNSIFPMLMNWCSNVYINLNENDRFRSEVPYRELRFANDLRAKYTAHSFERSAPIMSALRSIKSEEEIQAIRKACGITEKAFRRVLGFIRPGVAEYEIEAEITHEFIRNRATGHAYTPIIASGANANVLHYIDNNQECRSGELVLMDFGAEYANYAADLTRTVPVSGKFSPRQREVYNAVLRVMKAATQMLVAGNTIEQYHTEVGRIMEKELIGLGLLKAEEVAKQDPSKPLYKKYFMHGTSHFLGLDVHDVGSRHEPMKAGMVFTCEPGIYIPEEKMGIRLENDILITEKGPVDLMASIPLEADDIEALMAAQLANA
jgi:Xaa-Pro aminopeptidase